MYGLEYLMEPVQAADEQVLKFHRMIADKVEARYGITQQELAKRTVLAGVSTMIGTVISYITLDGGSGKYAGEKVGIVMNVVHGTGSGTLSIADKEPLNNGIVEGASSTIDKFRQQYYELIRGLRMMAFMGGLTTVGASLYNVATNLTLEHIIAGGVGVGVTLTGSSLYFKDESTPPKRKHWKNLFNTVKEYVSEHIPRPHPKPAEGFNISQQPICRS